MFENNFFQLQIKNYYSNWVKLIRNEESLGIVQSRQKGVDLARGGILTFLDAHCETTVGWLEPLLQIWYSKI